VVVGDLDVKLGGALDDLLPLPRRNIVSDFGGISSVVHQQELDILNVADEEGFEAVGAKVSGLLVVAITDLRHGDVALEPSSDAGVNTLGFSPAWLDAVPSVRVKADKVLLALFEDLGFRVGDETDHF